MLVFARFRFAVRAHLAALSLTSVIKDKVNPGSVVLSGVMMLEHLGWQEAADMVVKALENHLIKKW